MQQGRRRNVTSRRGAHSAPIDASFKPSRSATRRHHSSDEPRGKHSRNIADLKADEAQAASASHKRPAHEPAHEVNSEADASKAPKRNKPQNAPTLRTRKSAPSTPTKQSEASSSTPLSAKTRTASPAPAQKPGKPKQPEPPSQDAAKPSVPEASAESAVLRAPATAPMAPADKSEQIPVYHTIAPTQLTYRKMYQDNPRIYYMNGDSLSRPLELPQNTRAGLVVLLTVAAIIAGVVFYMFFDATANEPAREQAKMEESLSRNVPLKLPNILSLVELDDAGIDAAIKSSGDTFFERSPVGSGDEYEIVKLPAGVDLIEAASLYATGLSKLSPSQAATLLNGSWDLKVDRTQGLNISLHYADFTSGNAQRAIQNAITSEDLGRGTVTDSGDDDGFGNVYTTGTIMINGKSYEWTVSAIQLSEVYSINGLPDDAYYVGIRIRNDQP